MTSPITAAVSSKRILVALDNSTRGRAALKAAVQIALDSSLELQGLFVEDEDLVKLAGLPFACEVDFASASSHQLGTLNMERALRVAAEETQQAFSNALEQLNLQWTFRIIRGSLIQASLAAAGDDLLVFGQKGRSAQSMAADYLLTRTVVDPRVAVVFDGSNSAYRALQLASKLTKPAQLRVLVLSSRGNELAQQCCSWLAERHVQAEITQVDENRIIDAVRKPPASVLVINRDSEFIDNAQICRLVNEFDCPLILC